MIPSADPRMTIADHSMMPPTVSEALRRAWITRGQNFAIEISQVREGAVLAREHQPDEYMVLLADVPAQVAAGAESVEAGADSLLIAPPGASRITARADGLIVRVFSAQAADMLALAANQAPYREPRADVAPLVTWPAPVGGYKLRCYRMDDYVKAGSKMRIFRCQHLMINVLTRRDKARDIHAMSPHSHADFEQGSTSLWGTFEHHLRWPWSTDMAAWRDDEHPRLGAPSVTIMAPGVIHTSNNVGDVPAWLIDVFAPPRLDFSAKAGYVCNEDEYPLPAASA